MSSLRMPTVRVLECVCVCVRVCVCVCVCLCLCVCAHVRGSAMYLLSCHGVTEACADAELFYSYPRCLIRLCDMANASWCCAAR